MRARAPTRPGARAQRLDTELGEIQSLLSELMAIQRSFAADTRFSALPPKLAALAHWQECVLNNALVARMRMHTGGASAGGASAAPAGPSTLPTASQFLEQRPAARPMPRPMPVASHPYNPMPYGGHHGAHHGGYHAVAHAPHHPHHAAYSHHAPPGYHAAAASSSALAGASLSGHMHQHVPFPAPQSSSHHAAYGQQQVRPHRQYRLDEKIEMCGGGANAHEPSSSSRKSKHREH